MAAGGGLPIRLILVFTTGRRDPPPNRPSILICFMPMNDKPLAPSVSPFASGRHHLRDDPQVGLAVSADRHHQQELDAVDKHL